MAVTYGINVHLGQEPIAPEADLLGVERNAPYVAVTIGTATIFVNTARQAEVMALAFQDAAALLREATRAQAVRGADDAEAAERLYDAEQEG